MTKWLFKVLVILILISVVGCGNSNENSLELQEDINNSGYQPGNNVYHRQDWSFEYPKTFDQSGERSVSETSSGKTIQFEVAETTLEELRSWIDSEIERKLSSDEADQSLVEPLSETTQGNLTVFRYVIRSDSGDRDPVEIPTVIFFDGSMKYEFSTHQPQVSDEEFKLVLRTFKVDKKE